MLFNKVDTFNLFFNLSSNFMLLDINSGSTNSLWNLINPLFFSYKDNHLNPFKFCIEF